MKLLIVGYGSIGKRHAANARAFGEVLVCEKDAERVKDFDGTTHTDLDVALAEKPDGVVIALPNAYHYEAAKKALAAGAFVLVEKPICNDLSQARELVELGGERLFVVCNMRYHQAILALQDGITEIGKPLFARAQFGNYLPNMRVGVDYTSLYVAKEETGGGVVMDCIHELDYLQYLFGAAKDVSASVAKISDLRIETEDYAAISVTHESGVCSEIHLDYLQQVKQRGCEIIGSEGSVVWRSEGKSPEHCQIRVFNKDEQVWKTLIDEHDLDMNLCYVSLLQAFVNTINGQADPVLSDGSQGFKALALVKAAKESSNTGARIDMKDFLGALK